MYPIRFLSSAGVAASVSLAVWAGVPARLMVIRPRKGIAVADRRRDVARIRHAGRVPHERCAGVACPFVVGGSSRSREINESYGPRVLELPPTDAF